MRKASLVIAVMLVSVTSCFVNRQRSEEVIPRVGYEFSTNENGAGSWFRIEFQRGTSFYYPLMAVWLEDIEGKYIQTLYVPNSVARSNFKYGVIRDGAWQPGVRRHPQIVPYWAHKRGVKASDGLYMPDQENPVPDAYSGATPVTGFILNARADKPIEQPVKVLVEINQNWDWNEYWTNDKFPGDEHYSLSCQPAVVYEALLDPDLQEDIVMKPIGHSHPSGATGELFTDISTLTTALTIVDSIVVRLVK